MNRAANSSSSSGCVGGAPCLPKSLGVATMPYNMVEKDIAEGRLRVVSPESTSEIDIIMAWRRDSMGEAKSWCLREIPKLFSGK